MKSRYSKKILPFAPGVPWTIYNNRYIVPEIDYDTWERSLSNKSPVIISYGGLLESFYSLSIAEALNTIGQKEIFWIGNYDLITFNGLISKYPHENINSNILHDYPAPLFFDNNGNFVFFNCLNNYLKITGYMGIGEKENKAPIIKQIFDNSLIGKWDKNYLPKLRHLDFHSNDYKKWEFLNKFKSNKPYIVIFDKSGYSQHNINYLNWSNKEIAELSVLLYRFGINVVYCTNSKYVVYNSKIYQIPFTLENAFNLIKNAWGILSKDIDFLFIAMSLSDANIISNNVDGSFNLFDNINYIERDNIIYCDNNLAPIDVYLFCEGNLS